MQPWHETNIRDMTFPIHNRIRQSQMIQQQELTAEMHKIPPPIATDNSEYIRLTEALRVNGEFGSRLREKLEAGGLEIIQNAEAIIRSAPFGTREEKEELIKELMPRIEEVRYYLAHKTFKDREKWIAVPYGN
jgi:hypothetical protein